MLKGLLVFLLSMTPLAAEVKEEKVTHAGAVFRVVRLDPSQVEMVCFLMNAGISEPGLIPSGLYIQCVMQRLFEESMEGR